MTYPSALRRYAQAASRLNAHRPHLGNRGVTLVEFGLVGPIFLLIALLVMQFSLELFQQVMLDYETHTIARRVQLGEIATSVSASDIARAICNDPDSHLYDCANRLSVKEWASSGNSFSGASLTIALVADGAPGISGDLMIVDATYTAPYIVPWLSRLANTSAEGIFSRAVFQNEPF